MGESKSQQEKSHALGWGFCCGLETQSQAYIFLKRNYNLRVRLSKKDQSISYEGKQIRSQYLNK
jgi:hypothetical protein